MTRKLQTADRRPKRRAYTKPLFNTLSFGHIPYRYASNGICRSVSESTMCREVPPSVSLDLRVYITDNSASLPSILVFLGRS